MCMLLFIRVAEGVKIEEVQEKLNDLSRFISGYKGVELIDTYESIGGMTGVFECICSNIAISVLMKHIKLNLEGLYKTVSTDYTVCIELDNFYSNYVWDGLRELAENQARSGVNCIRFYPKNEKAGMLTLNLTVGNISKSLYKAKETTLIEPVLKMTGVKRVYPV